VERPKSDVIMDASNATRVIVQRVPLASEPESGFPVATFRMYTLGGGFNKCGSRELEGFATTGGATENFTWSSATVTFAAIDAACCPRTEHDRERVMFSPSLPSFDDKPTSGKLAAPSLVSCTGTEMFDA